MVADDDGIRPGVTPQALGGLKAVFKKGGTTTAGNSSQVRPGAGFKCLAPVRTGGSKRHHDRPCRRGFEGVARCCERAVGHRNGMP